MATFTFTAGVDEFIGGSANDVFVIGPSALFGPDDFLIGGLGADTLRFGGTLAGDTLVLDDRVEEIEFVALTGTVAINLNAAVVDNALRITGNSAANILTGTIFSDVLSGGLGNDTLHGGAGNDVLAGSTGNDALNGDAGNDTLNAGAGTDAQNAGAGNDILLVSTAAELPAAEIVDGGNDADTLRFTTTVAATLVLGANVTNVETVQISTAAGATTGIAASVNAQAVTSNGLALIGSNGANTLIGTFLDDTLTGNSGNDRLFARDGADTLLGGAGNDTLAGESGNDVLEGNAGVDSLSGGDGNDLVVVRSLAELTGDTVNGGNDADTLRLASMNGGELYVLAPTRLLGIERVEIAGVSGDATGTHALHVDASAMTVGLSIAGNAGANTLIGGAAGDSIEGGAGDDLLAGLSGDDALAGGAGGDILSAGAGSDTLRGGGGADLLRGGMGNDRLELAAGDYETGETLDGGSGNADVLALTGASQILDLTAIPDAAVRNIEIVDIGGTSDNGLKLEAADVLAINASGTLRVDGNEGDAVSVTDGGWTEIEGTDIGGAAYAQYQSGDATLQVRQGVFFDSPEINAAPTGADRTLVTDEDAAYTFAAVDFGYSDLDGDLLQAVRIENLPANGTLTLSGETVSEGAIVLLGSLDELVFTPEPEAGGTAYASFTFSVQDAAGEFDAFPNTITFDVIAANDAPFISVNGSPGYALGGAPVVIDATIIVGDADSAALAGATVTLVNFQPGDQLHFADQSGITGSYDDDTGVLSLSGAAAPAAYQAALQTVEFSTASLVTADRTVSFAVHDGELPGAADTATVRIEDSAFELQLADLDGADGFRITGAAPGDRSGFSVSGAGDVNGDGFADLLVGGTLAVESVYSTTAAYVVFGGAGGSPASVDLAALDGTAGFMVTAGAAFDGFGRSVGVAGDINGDGLADLVIGAPAADPGGIGSGGAYVVLGRTEDFPAIFDVSAIAGPEGFRLFGADAGDGAGSAVSTAGDVNGDGFADLVVGAFGADSSGPNSGAGYVVLGATAFPSPLDLGSPDGAVVFSLRAAAAGNYTGISVSRAGDVNGDGVGDLITGALRADPNGLNSGAAYVAFGTLEGFETELDLGGLNGENGFRLSGAAAGDLAGIAVGAAGDVNGDGYGDVIVGAIGADAGGPASGASYVVFGGAGGFEPDIDLADLDGDNGFRLSGAAAGDYSGRSVHAAGDVNGDGVDDLIVGAHRADPNGASSGAAYLVFGSRGGFAADLDLGELDGTTGFLLSGAAAKDLTGFSASAAGDVNGDGFADLIIGAYGADAGAAEAGASYVVFGADFRGEVDFLGTAGADTFGGGAGAEIFVSGQGGDVLAGGGGADVFHAGAGDDAIAVSDTAFDLVDGGSGSDALQLAGAGLTLDLSAPGDARVSGVEAIDLTGAGNNALVLGKLDLLALSDTGNLLVVDGNVGDRIETTDGWTFIQNVAGGDETYAEYVNGAAVLRVNVDVDRSDIIEPQIGLGALDGGNGFRIPGVGGGENSGAVVNDAGDVNGDGFGDLVISTFSGNAPYGASYVVFGRADGFADNFDLAALDGSNGFRVTGGGTGGNLLIATVAPPASGAGDINGDGFDDLVFGAPFESSGYNNSGAAFVLFGKSDWSGSPSFDLSGLDGENGFRLSDQGDGHYTGLAAGTAGDINGDGYDDLVVGSPGADFNGSFSGAAYVVFGKAAGFAADLGVSDLDGANGFAITGSNSLQLVGTAVGGGGDVDGDGLADLLVGAPALNAAFLMHGREAGFEPQQVAQGLSGDLGFSFGFGAGNFGYAVADAGDVNGDGIGDLIVGAPLEDSTTGAAYVIFGRAGGFDEGIDLSSLDGTDGFRVSGESLDHRAGIAVGGAADVNGDGYDDLIVGADDAGGPGGFESGAAYLIFGGAGGFGGNLSLAEINGVNGIKFFGAAANDQAGRSVSGAGDVNGDGFADLIVGARYADAAGANSGASYVVFGGDLTNTVDFLGGAANDTLAGTAGDEELLGGQGADSLDGGAGSDVLIGGSGNDVLVFDGADRRVDGGTGEDTLSFAGSAQSLNLSASAGNAWLGIEVIDLSGSGTNSLFLGKLDLLALSSEVNALRVDGDAGDIVVTTDFGWTAAGETDMGDVTYAAFVKDGATLLVDTAVDSTGVDTRVGEIFLADLDGDTGARINGADANDRAGVSVSGAGDVNGDGYDDFIIGAARANPDTAPTGAAYVVFGGAAGFPADLDLAALDGADGFLLAGEAEYDFAGFSVSGAGDVNGDGFDDLLIGAYEAASAYSEAGGATYVVFGSDAGFGARLDLSSLDGGNGFRLAAVEDFQRVGRSVSGAGDVNGDGLADLVIGAPYAGGGGYYGSGAAYVVFGAGDFGPDFDLTSLDGTNGVRLNGASDQERAGISVKGAGDVNGDGLADVIVGARSGTGGYGYFGTSYVVFGKATPFDPELDLGALDGTGGFRISGTENLDFAHFVVGGAGDVNGDGFDDLIVGADSVDLNGLDSGAAYVVFGKAAPFDPDFDLSGLDGTNGFRLTGGAAYGGAGVSVSGAGDVNGDGYADLLIGADRVSGEAGAAYIVFGKAGGFDASIDLDGLTPSTGISLLNETVADRAGRAVSAAGDVDGDGFFDLLVGAPYADGAGGESQGAAYLVFGRDFPEIVDFVGGGGADLFAGTAGEDLAVGGRGNDTLQGDAGNDALSGGEGADVLEGGAGSDRLEGGTGADTADYTDSATAVTVNLLLGTGTSGDAAGDILAGIENLVGSASADTLTGDGKDNVLAGLAGADALDGGVGSDTADYSASSGAVTVNLLLLTAAGGDAAGDSLSSMENLIGSSQADILTGNGEANRFRGGAEGDTIDGGIGSDTADYVGSAAGVTIDLGLGTASGGDAAGDSLASIENLVGSAHDDSLTGDGEANRLDGGAGADSLAGGGGDDTYVVDNDLDAVTEGAAGGTDMVESSVTFALADPDLENLTLTGDADVDGIGNEAANVIIGNRGDNTLIGLGGADAIQGGAGNDLIDYDPGDTSVHGGGGTDTLRLFDDTQTLDLTVPHGLSAIEVMVLDGAGDALILDAASLLALSDTGTLRVDGGVDDALAAGAGWQFLGDIVIGLDTYAQYAQGDALLQVDTDIDADIGFTSELSTLNGGNGFKLPGEAPEDRSGNSVSGAGDVNGDGYGDVVVSAHLADAGGVGAGASYVVFGKAGGFAPLLELSSLDGTTGFKLSGEAVGDQAGFSVSGAGDVNGDGIGDFIVGARNADAVEFNVGASYVVFGRGDWSATAGDFDLSSLDGATGFKVVGAAGGDTSGYSVSNAGDVNGDGYDDLLIGAPYSSAFGASSGAAYVVFGKGAGFAPEVQLSSLDGINGFRLEGTGSFAAAGRAVSAAGDVNGDGFDDLLIGEPGGGIAAAYVVFGKGSGFAASINLSNLYGPNGFGVNVGSFYGSAGTAVSGAGDINGDGFDDFVVSAPQAHAYGDIQTARGEAFVVFGDSGGFPGTLDVFPNGTSAFSLIGEYGQQVGISVSGAGDVNGDGYDDLLVGANSTGGNLYSNSFSGASYVVFGRAGGFNPTISLEQLAANQGYRLTGLAPADYAGRSVSGAGDVNGDGYDDLIVGAPFADSNGYTSGESYVIFGGDTADAIPGAFEGGTGADAITGTGGAEILIGAQGNDTLDGAGGADVLRGGEGDDVLAFTGAERRVDGGSGADTLRLGGGGQSLSLVAAAGRSITGIESIDLTGTGDNMLLFDRGGVARLSDTANFLRVDGNVGDTVFAGGGWIFDSSVIDGGQTYARYTQGAATLEVDVDITGVAFSVSPPFADLSALGGTAGVQLNGAAYSQSGYSVSRAGDVNGDGFDDVIVGTRNLNVSYVLFGGTDAALAALHGTAGFDLTLMDGNNGVELNGGAPGDRAGFSVSDAGDVNGDGMGDLIVGAYYADVPGGLPAEGRTYVVFGQSDWSGTLGSFALSTLNGTGGIKLNGANGQDRSGRSVGAAGDVNGDGYGDLIVGAQGADPHGSYSGASYVVFGGANSYLDTLHGTDGFSLGGINGVNGVRLNGVSVFDYSGHSVSGAGDVNGDGLDDLIVGAADGIYGKPGASYVVFGQSDWSGTAGTFELSAIDGANGVKLNGAANYDHFGFSVSAAGDINGDGFGDLVVGAYRADVNNIVDSGAAYVVFGGGNAYLDALHGADGFDLSAIDGANGLQLNGRGEFSGDYTGWSVSGAGDVNGDGYDDLIVGAKNADPRVSDGGVSYVVFGGSSAYLDALNGAEGVDLNALDGAGGFRLDGADSRGYAGVSVGGAGDVNGDGFDDLIVGAHRINANYAYDSGASYVVFGGDFRNEVDVLGDDVGNTLTGGAAHEILVGGLGNDTLDGADGADVLRGGGGDDLLVFDGADRRVDGGSGEDILQFARSGESLDLTGIANGRYAGIEIVDLGGGGNLLTLNLGDLLDLSGTTNTLRVDGNAGDAVSSTGQGWVAGGTVEVFPTVFYQSYTAGAATLLLDPDIVATSTIT